MWLGVVLVGTAFVTCAAHAFTATASTSFNYGTYVSQYVRLDNGGSWSWDAGYSACESYGTGWHIAGIYSSDGNAAVMSIFDSSASTANQGYIGGLSPLGEDYNTAAYIWYGGRFKGELISLAYSPSTCMFYCNYAEYEPNGATCDGNSYRESALQIYTTGLWNDIHETGCPGDPYPAVICERSSCTVAADCYAAGTASVSGSYAPDCTCNCKSGYRGGKCQVLATTVSDSGTDYAAFCESSILSASQAQAKCVALGTGWNLASIPSATVDNLLSGLTADTMWTGGAYDTSMNLYKWQYGRLAGLFFANGPSSKTCLTTIAGETMYCNWQSGSPNRATCGDNSAVENDVVKKGSRWSTDRQWDDLWSTGCGQQVRYMTFCYACERSACNINLDCVAANTVSISGSYYPSCTCTCKIGFGGSRCETNTTVVKIDSVEYAVECASTYISSPTAQSYCQARGQYWTLASVRSAAANAAIYNAAPNANIWIGGWYNSATGCDNWLYGRLAGQKYSCGTKTSVVCQSGMYCNWNSGQPDRIDCGDGNGPQAYVNIFGYIHSSVWDDTFYTGCGQAAGRTRCYACERSTCVQSDCKKYYTRPLGYYPACTCSTITATVTFSLLVTATHSEVITASTSLSGGSSSPTTTMSASSSASLSSTNSLSATASLSASRGSVSATETASSSLSPTQSGNTLSLSLQPTATQTGPTTTFTATSSDTVSNTFSQTLSRSLSPSSSYSLTSSASTSPTASVSATRSFTASYSGTPSPTGGSTSETATIQDSFSPTYYANTTLVAEFLSLLPLFEVVIYEDATVRSGSSRSVFVKPIREALWALLFAAGNRRVRVRGVPVVKQVPALGDVGVTGNELGFYFEMPNVTILVPNSSALNVSLTPLPSYAIEVEERMLLYTSMRELLDVVVLMDHRDVDELHLIGTIEVYKPGTGMSVPSIVTTIITSGGGALGGMAPELQGVGALALMGCSDPNTKSRFGAYRALSPVAVQDSYAGVIIGNGILTFVVLAVQAGIVATLRFCHRVQRNIELMATARFPSLFFAAALAFHTGTAFASAQIISQPSDYAGWEIFFGVGGFIYSLLLPVVMAAHPYLRVGRAYQTYERQSGLPGSDGRGGSCGWYRGERCTPCRLGRRMASTSVYSAPGRSTSSGQACQRGPHWYSSWLAYSTPTRSPSAGPCTRAWGSRWSLSRCSFFGKRPYEHTCPVGLTLRRGCALGVCCSAWQPQLLTDPALMLLPPTPCSVSWSS